MSSKNSGLIMDPIFAAIEAANFKVTGHRATLPHGVQVRNTIESMHTIRDGHDIRAYSPSARKELLSAGGIAIMSKDGVTVLTVVPKLALVVSSSVFREYLSNNPNATSVKVTQQFVDDKAVSILMHWVTAIVRASDKKFAVGLPCSESTTIEVYHAAQVLGMQLYVRHFVRTYKDGLRNRVPQPAEVELMQRASRDGRDEMTVALGARLAYLRRNHFCPKHLLPSVQATLDRNPKVANAVAAADARVKAKYSHSNK